MEWGIVVGNWQIQCNEVEEEENGVTITVQTLISLQLYAFILTYKYVHFWRKWEKVVCKAWVVRS